MKTFKSIKLTGINIAIYAFLLFPFDCCNKQNLETN